MGTARLYAMLSTTAGGHELKLDVGSKAPGEEWPPMVKFLQAVMHRADEDIGWWEEQVAWHEREKGIPAPKPLTIVRVLYSNDNPDAA